MSAEGRSAATEAGDQQQGGSDPGDRPRARRHSLRADTAPTAPGLTGYLGGPSDPGHQRSQGGRDQDLDDHTGEQQPTVDGIAERYADR